MKAIASHRFLVQSRPIDDASFAAIAQGSQSQKATEVSYLNFYILITLLLYINILILTVH